MNTHRAGVLPGHIRRRVPLFHPDFPFILFWSQKSGCTTVAKWFFAQLGLLEDVLKHSLWVHDYEYQVFKKRPNYRKDLMAALASGDYEVVKVVRSPWLRAPSSFLILSGPGAVSKQRHWVQAYWEEVDAWLIKNGRDPASGISFMDHLTMVREVEAAGAQTINPHLSAQFIPGEEAVVATHVPIEEFRDWTRAQVDRGIGVKALDFDRIAHSDHHRTSHEAAAAALGERPELVPIARGAYGNGRFPSGRIFVNDRSRDAIAQTYAADFNAYGHLYRD